MPETAETKKLSGDLSLRFPRVHFYVEWRAYDATVVVNYDAYASESTVKRIKAYMEKRQPQIYKYHLERIPF